MDYSRYLVLYSGGADSTYFIESEPTAKHLIHYEGRNKELTKLAVVNANLLDRYITILRPDMPGRDGETNQIHALYDAHMILDASIRAVSHGMKGIVACFNKDDIGTDFDAIQRIMRRAEPEFEILLPLIDRTEADIRSDLTRSSLRTISCMQGDNCGYCAKCRRGQKALSAS